MSEQRIKGIGVSEGIRFGKAFIYGAPAVEAAYPQRIEPEQVEAELERLEQAKRQSAAELKTIIAKSEAKLGKDKTAIIEGQLSFLDDPAFYGDIRSQIKRKQASAEQAVQTVLAKLSALFEKMNNAYVKERIHDVKDVADRLMSHLQQVFYPDLASITEPIILVAEDLTPSVTVQLDRSIVLGFVTRVGGETTHTAILSRSLGIPAVVGTGAAFEQLGHGDELILDGTEGVIVLNADAATRSSYEARQQEEQSAAGKLAKYRLLPAQTEDGKLIELAVNVGMPEEMREGLVDEADGVGLFRTEFLFMNADRFPDEEKQFAVYKQLAEAWQGKPIVIRTLDIGGDKELSYWDLPHEDNPFLGNRAIRLCLNERELFRTQLRAIVRASAFGTVKIMFPMISSMQEFRAAKQLTLEVMDELKGQGITFDEKLEIGIMAEVPSVIQLADRFAKEVDFFSIGTNDLVQYTLAVDRMNEKVAHLYDYFHPAVIRSIHSLIQAAHKEGKWVGMCGKMAGDPLAAPLLLGMELDEWSMDAASVTKQKFTLSRLNVQDSAKLLGDVLDLDTAEEIRQQVKAFHAARFSE
ncbi:phosphotransferase system, enzyme I, PtsI [Paenibacillus algorifonticola]|uniref:Phosphoenolpyruvate-protein phosphotransferase n=1 Tax=Paenibacillus algorifonticola TaxID=684063 RepID=A0A1I2HE48_9BACL|nr:phosphoenolpyruvate--protein phosphotransferase [Paenibacillus algorifonticola]SFF27952.1 phosphotransferase system, enzyme I, PtsI [Paenibacillus algorifonticola]